MSARAPPLKTGWTRCSPCRSPTAARQPRISRARGCMSPPRSARTRWRSASRTISRASSAPLPSSARPGSPMRSTRLSGAKKRCPIPRRSDGLPARRPPRCCKSPTTSSPWNICAPCASCARRCGPRRCRATGRSRPPRRSARCCSIRGGTRSCGRCPRAAAASTGRWTARLSRATPSGFPARCCCSCAAAAPTSPAFTGPAAGWASGWSALPPRPTASPRWSRAAARRASPTRACAARRWRRCWTSAARPSGGLPRPFETV